MLRGIKQGKASGGTAAEKPEGLLIEAAGEEIVAEF
jgi:hypothetical protein